MKKLLILVLFLCAAAASVYAEFPASGKWYIEILGTPETYGLEINGNEWNLTLDGGIKTTLKVTIDEAKKTIAIPIFAAVADYFIYDDQAAQGYIDLYVGEKFNLNLFDAMIGSLQGLKGINGVSSDAVDKMVLLMQDIFLKVPILRLIPASTV